MSKENKYNFIYVGFDAHEPPVFKEAKNKDWILYGTDGKWKNRYPDYLIELYNTSPKHNAIVNGKVSYIVGQGFTCEGTMDLLTKSKVEGFIKSVGNDSLKELNYKVATDLELFGGYAVETILNRGGDKIAELHHIDFSKIRVSVDGSKFYYTSDWKSRKPEENEDFKEFVPFDPENPQNNSIIYYKTYRPDLKEYPLPSYIGSIPYIESEAEIANYTLNNIKSGFAASFIINFHNGEPTPDQQAWIEKQIKKKFTGSNNAGSFMLSFDDGKDKAVDVIPIQDDGHQDKFLNLIKQTGQEIYTGHGVTNPTLFGVKEDVGLGNNADELRTASEAFQNRYVTPKQDLLEELYNSVLVFNGLPGCLKIIRTEVVSKPFSEATVTQVMTTEEIREKLGLPTEEVNVNEVAESLGTISPLVATKVLESMTSDEIRAIVGLPPRTRPSQPTLSRQFSSEEFEQLFKDLENSGINDEDYEVVSTKFMDYNPFVEQERAEMDERSMIKHAFVSELGLNILNLLTDHPDMTVEEISVATGESEQVVENEINKLQEEGKLNDSGKPVEKEVEEVEEELFMVYKYALRPDAPPLKGSSSRPFCERLMNLSNAMKRSWTRQQISGMRNGQGLDVFRSRGGFYNNNGVITPYCRHIWEGRLVRKK